MKKELIIVLISLLLIIPSVYALNADFAIYTGSGTWEHSITSFEKFLDWKNLTYEEINSWDLNHANLSGNYKAIFFPGGWAYNYKKSIHSSGNQNIRDFIQNGGSYIGMSAGAYFACDNVNWEGQNYPYYLNLFHGSCVGPIEEIAPWPNYVMTTMAINNSHSANIYEPATEDILYYGEPYFIPDQNQEMQVLASWIVPANPSADNTPGIIGFNYGEGRVLLFGPHPEIEEDSQRDGNQFAEELNDNGSDWPFLWTSVDWLLKSNISQPPELPAGQSPSLNDTIPPSINSFFDSPDPLYAGNILIIKANITDNIKVDTVKVSILENFYIMNLEFEKPLTLYFDNFESGTLASWTNLAVSGAQKWTASKTNPYQGSWHAQSQPRSTSEPASVLEKTIPTTNQEGITIKYSRRLIGLDTVDEFKVKWFDGSTWNILEQTLSSSANDPSYLIKTFSLPQKANNNPSFKIRFECTAGAVSEYCRIDNLNISAKSSPSTIYSFFLNTSVLSNDTYTYAISVNDSSNNQPIPQGGEFSVIM
ncbi:MAG: BPL-N domain-containing protein [Nanoarchaeota archaeon]|nr:BPL-N domain-containing protein [Nanoarchaeota archaeon]